MSYGSGNQGGEGGGNVWSSGSHGGSRGEFSRSYDNDNDGQGSRDSRPYRGSYGNSYSRGGGGGGGGGGSGGSYGFRRDRDNDRQMEIQRDTIFIQDLPKDVTKEQLSDAFSGVGRIKIDDRNGGPKVWLYKDRMTDEGNGRATVTYEDEETASRAISEYNDQHIDSLGVTVRVQQAQRRPRTNDRGGFGGGGRGYRGGRSGWDSNNSRSGGGFSSDGNRWGGSRGGSGGSGGFSDSRDNYRGQGGFGGGSSGGGGDSYRNSDDRDGGYRGGSQHRGASRGRGGVSNYSPY